MQPSGPVLSPKAIGWALLSQAVWLPLVAIDLHDRWVAHQRDISPPGQSLPPSPLARATPFSLNDLLGAARPVQQLAGQANQAVSGALGQAAQGAASGVGLLLSSAGSSASSLLDRPFTTSLEASAEAASRSPGRSEAALSRSGESLPSTLLKRAFTPAQLLGGSLSLADLQEGPMAPLALAERALQRGSGDPLAPLPSAWREPIRQALLKLPGAPRDLSPARMVHVPSRAVSQPVEVPLALQSDGSVDILETPANAAVLREIDGWSRQQRLPATGSLTPAVVHLHPLTPEAPLSAPSMGRPAGTAASQPDLQPSSVRTTPVTVHAEASMSAPPQQAPEPPPAAEPAAHAPAEVAPAPEPVAVAAPPAAEMPAEVVAPAP